MQCQTKPWVCTPAARPVAVRRAARTTFVRSAGGAGHGRAVAPVCVELAPSSVGGQHRECACSEALQGRHLPRRRPCPCPGPPRASPPHVRRRWPCPIRCRQWHSRYQPAGAGGAAAGGQRHADRQRRRCAAQPVRGPGADRNPAGSLACQQSRPIACIPGLPDEPLKEDMERCWASSGHAAANRTQMRAPCAPSTEPSPWIPMHPSRRAV